MNSRQYEKMCIEETDNINAGFPEESTKEFRDAVNNYIGIHDHNCFDENGELIDFGVCKYGTEYEVDFAFKALHLE